MNITDIASDLAQARSDVDRLAQLQGAAKRAEALQKQYGLALAEQEREATERAATEREASYGGVTDIRIVGTENAQARANVLATSFTIFYTQPQWDMREQRSKPTERRVNGFMALPRPAMLYLLEKRPELIPASIRDLSPDDPHAAMDAYFQALRRGHL